MGNTSCCSSQPIANDEKPADTKVIQFLSKVELFKRLPQELYPVLASCSSKIDFKAGDVIIRQGEEGHEFYVIMTGEARVDIDGKTVASLGCGDYFGESALLRDEPRTATITANLPITTLRITQEQFQRLRLHERLDFARRGAVVGGLIKDVVTKPPSPKTEAEKKLIIDALLSNKNLSQMTPLTEQQRAHLVSHAWKETVPPGTELIKEGDLEADYFYIVNEGQFEVSVSNEGVKSVEQAASTSQGVIEKAGSFGELALLYFAPRAATVTAKVQSEVFVIDRKNFKETMQASEQHNIKTLYVEYLKKVEILSALNDDERLEIAKALLEESFHKDEVIMQQGEKGEMFYILINGEVSVEKGGKEEVRLQGVKEKPHIFGEMALLSNEPRAATIKVVSETATCLTLDRESFQMLLGPLKSINDRGAGGESKVGMFNRQGSMTPDPGDRKFGLVSRKDLVKIGLLGCGGFGAVELVEHKKTGETYALKSLSKGYVVKSGMQSSVISEKNVQLLCDSPFIIKLYETYLGEQTLYFLLELALGGELYATYHKKSMFGKEPHAKFYVSGVVYAFDHMHTRRVIFRDLKPENILLTETGRVKLTDMGLAKVVVGKTYTTCGTPDYFAPELIKSSGHTRSLDWWTLGILLFELLTGRTPFESATQTPHDIFHKVIKGINRVEFPKNIKGHAEDLVKGLCKAEPSERLPMKKGGIVNIQEHPFYTGFDWAAMLDQTLTPPYVPPVKNRKDFANFSARKEDLPPQIPYKDDGTGWDEGFATST